MLTNREQKILERIETQFNIFMIPTLWAMQTVMKARSENYIEDDMAVYLIFHVM